MSYFHESHLDLPPKTGEKSSVTNMSIRFSTEVQNRHMVQNCKFSLNHKRLQIRTDTTLDHPVTWSATLQLTDMMYNYGNMLHPALPLISNLVAQIEIRSQRTKLKIGAAGTDNCRALLAVSL